MLRRDFDSVALGRQQSNPKQPVAIAADETIVTRVGRFVKSR